jgi:hypothetical protein
MRSASGQKHKVMDDGDGGTDSRPHFLKSLSITDDG